MTEKNLFGLCKLQTSIIVHIDFVHFREHTHPLLFSCTQPLHPIFLLRFSFFLLFFFSLQRCIICAKLFYRLKKPTACIEYGIIRFYWIQGIAFMFIFVGIYIFFQKKSSPIHPEKANYKIVLWKDIRKVFHHTQVSQICNNLKSFLFEHYGNHVM